MVSSIRCGWCWPGWRSPRCVTPSPGAILVIDQQSLDTMLFWLAGSLSASDATRLYPLLLPGAGLVVIAALFARQMNVLNAGEAIARGLGQNIARVRLIASVLVVAGCAVALAGNIGFVGLMVPHIVRQIFGSDLRRTLPACALLGAMLLLTADIAARLIIVPQEVPVGVMTALLGAPFFIMLAQRRGEPCGGNPVLRWGAFSRQSARADVFRWC